MTGISIETTLELWASGESGFDIRKPVFFYPYGLADCILSEPFNKKGKLI